MSIAAPSQPDGIARILAGLAGARRRGTLQAVANAALAGTLVALALFCLLSLLSAVFGQRAPWLALPGLPAPAALETALGTALAHQAVAAFLCGAAVFAILSVAGALRVPALPLLARAADRRFGMRERISTATELKERPESELTSVARALLDDVARSGSPIDVRRLMPFRGSPVVLAGVPILLLLSAAIVTFGWPGGSSEPAAPTAMEAPIAPPERTEIAEGIARVAELIAADAGDRDDPYLRAVARELAAVGEAVEGAALDRNAIARELSRLLPVAEDAYARAGVEDQAPDNLARLVEAALQDVAQPRAAPALPPNAGGAIADGGVPAGDAGGRPAAEGAGREQQGALEQLLDQVGRDDAPMPNAAITPPAAGAAGPVVEADYAAEGRIEAPPQAAPEGAANDRAGAALGAAPAGAAANAGDAAGDAAGEGVQPLEGGGITAFGDLPQPTEEMLLADEADGNGRTIRLDAPPEAGVVALPEGERTAGGWVRLPEGEVARRIVPPSARDLFRRYFSPAGRAGE